MACIDITDQNFDSMVLQSNTPVLVDFWAEWCGPCRLAGPVLEELSEAYAGKVAIVKLNVDQNQVNPGKYGIMSIPTTILFKDGKELGRTIGFSGKQAFEELIQKGVTS